MNHIINYNVIWLKCDISHCIPHYTTVHYIYTVLQQISQYTTLNHTWSHCRILLMIQRTIHPTLQHCSIHCTTPNWTALHYTTLNNAAPQHSDHMSLHHTASDRLHVYHTLHHTLYHTVVHCTKRHHTTLHHTNCMDHTVYTAQHYTSLQCTHHTNYTTLHYITLH